MTHTHTRASAQVALHVCLCIGVVRCVGVGGLVNVALPSLALLSALLRCLTRSTLVHSVRVLRRQQRVIYTTDVLRLPVHDLVALLCQRARAAH